MSHISVIHPIAPRSKIGGVPVKDLNGNPATNPSINLLLLNCASQYTPISTTSNRSTARAYSFTVASSPDGVVQATIADGNDTIACNNQGGTLWQITAYYDATNQQLAWKHIYNITGSSWDQSTATPVVTKPP